MDHHHQDKATQVSLDDDDDDHDDDDGGRPPPPGDSSLITGQLLDIVAKVLILFSIVVYLFSHIFLVSLNIERRREMCLVSSLSSSHLIDIDIDHVSVSVFCF